MLSTNKPEVGRGMRPWNVLLEATIQGAKFQGTITCHAMSEDAAKRLAQMTFINLLRQAGVWASQDTIEESYEKKVNKKTVYKTRKVIQYKAPTWDHVKALEIIDVNEKDLTFPLSELEEQFTPKRKRRTSQQVTLEKRKKKQAKISKTKTKSKKFNTTSINTTTIKLSKDDLLQAVAKYFTEPKVIKDASKTIGQTYQRIRYALFLIKDNGLNDKRYKLKESSINGHKAYQLIKE